MVYKLQTGVKRAKKKTYSFISGLGVLIVPGVIALFSGGAAAATQVIVTPPVGSGGWSTSDTRPGGSVNFVADSSAPGNPNSGALQLTTDATTAAKAQYLHSANTTLSSVNELSYYTKQNSATFPEGEASYQLPVCLGGVSGTTCTGFTTLVFEPYENLGNNGNAAVIPGTWQQWDVSAATANLWSSRTYTDGGLCTVAAGAGGAPFYNITALKTACPNAVVVGFGVNVGTFNPGYDVEADLVDFNGTVYNFEPFIAASDKDQCKKDGWMNVTDANGNHFKNQGDCVSYVATNGRNPANG